MMSPENDIVITRLIRPPPPESSVKLVAGDSWDQRSKGLCKDEPRAITQIKQDFIGIITRDDTI